MIEYLIITGIYLLPTIIAVYREQKQPILIFFLNLTIGWTVIGWFILILLAVRNEKKKH